MTWGAIGGAAVSLVGGELLNGGSSGGGGGGQPPYYIPTGLAGADSGWQDMFGGSRWLSSHAEEQAMPGFDQSLRQQNVINYQPYQQGMNTAGAMYGDAARIAQQEGGWQVNNAGAAQQAQGRQYQAGDQIMHTAMDPQQQLYQRTQQQLQEQTRAGQAARGLGNSAVGAGLESQAMSNFDIDWQNQQLARQVQGVGAMSQAYAGAQGQGQLVGADLQASMQDYGNAGGYQHSAAQIPMQAQEYIAGRPAANAQQYQQEMQAMQGMYGAAGGMAIPYMNYGQGAQQQNYSNVSGNNAQQAQLLGQIGSAVMPYATQWFNGGNPSGGTGMGSAGQGLEAFNTPGYGGGV